jgi:hypothetical protein
MVNIIFNLICLLGITTAAFDVPYPLKQDENTEKYYLQVYVGFQRIRKMLLVDFLANGTVIDYDPHSSNTARMHLRRESNITLFDNSTYTGYEVEDGLCLDDDDDICVARYSFFDFTEKINF